jgi:hypothetical protein
MLHYLSSPFTNKDPEIQESNRRMVCLYAAQLITHGIQCISPIAHNLAVIKEAGLSTGWELWKAQDLAILRACGAMIVLMLPGWQQSVGVAEEIKTAEELGIPVEYHYFSLTTHTTVTEESNAATNG